MVNKFLVNTIGVDNPVAKTFTILGDFLEHSLFTLTGDKVHAVLEGKDGWLLEAEAVASFGYGIEGLKDRVQVPANEITFYSTAPSISKLAAN